MKIAAAPAEVAAEVPDVVCGMRVRSDSPHRATHDAPGRGVTRRATR
ncbi:MAG TPA: hypothetical protein VGJ98_07770 [Candidatus Eisenbacteria bacterium]